MNFDPEVKKNIRDIAVCSLICALIVLIAFTVFDKFSFPLLFGTVVGYVLGVGNFILLAASITVALDTGEEQQAKKKMASSKIIRTVVILAVIAGAILLDTKTGIIKWIPVALGVFYTRISISLINFLAMFKAQKKAASGTDKPAPSYEPVIDDEDENEEDGFEKFVGHFAKGPVPGKENNKEDNK